MNVPLGDTYYFKFTTRSFSTGAPTTLSGTPVVSVYEENNLTQITTGVTLTADYDSVTGLNDVAVVATTGNGYEVGKYYSAVITTGTVGGVSVVGETVGHFRVMPAEDAGAGIPDVNVTHVGDSAEDIATATALATVDSNVDAILVDTGTTLPATLGTPADTDLATDIANVSQQINGIGASAGGALAFEASTDNTGGAIKSVTFVGSQTGTFANTYVEDGSYHQITHATNDFDIVYSFAVGGGRTASEVTWKGYLDGANDNAVIQAYDFVGAGWDTLATITGKGGTTNDTIAVPLLSKHTGTGADLGTVLIRIDGQGDDTAPILYTDQIVVSAVSIGQTVGYANGAIYVDTNGSNTSTESFVDGVADNAVSTIAAATTISGNVGLKRFQMWAGSSITLAQTYNNYEFLGEDWTLALGGQDIGNSYISGASNGVSGTGTGTSPFFHECSIGAVTLPPCALDRCGLSSTLTLGSAGDYFLVDCFSQVAGASSPTIDMGAAVGATNLSLRRWSGGITINNLAAGDVVSLEGIFGTITLNGADAQVEIRGIAKAVTNNLTGSPTVNDNSVKTTDIATIDTNVDAILADTGTTLDNKIDVIDGIVDTLNLGIITGAAAAGTLSTTQATSNLTGYADDQLIGRTIIWTSGACDGEATDITDYANTGGLLTFTALTTAPSASDTFKIV